MDIVTIYPEEGNFPVVARALLAVADHPGQVRYVSHPQAGFQVPAEVFERFESESSEDEGSDDAEPKKRRGRPRKAAEAPKTPDPEKGE